MFLPLTRNAFSAFDFTVGLLIQKHGRNRDCAGDRWAVTLSGRVLPGKPISSPAWTCWLFISSTSFFKYSFKWSLLFPAFRVNELISDFLMEYFCDFMQS